MKLICVYIQYSEANISWVHRNNQLVVLTVMCRRRLDTPTPFHLMAQIVFVIFLLFFENFLCSCYVFFFFFLIYKLRIVHKNRLMETRLLWHCWKFVFSQQSLLHGQLGVGYTTYLFCVIPQIQILSSWKWSEMVCGSLEWKYRDSATHLVKTSHRLLYKEDQCDSLERERVNVEFSPNMCRALLKYSRLHG